MNGKIEPTDAQGAMPPNPRRWWFFALRLAGTVAIFAVLFSTLPMGDLFAAMLRTGLALWVATVVVHTLVHGLVALKWRGLLTAAGVAINRIDALRAHGAGLFANICLPSIIGGDAIRMGFVVRGGGRLTAALTAGMADRATDVIALITLSAAGTLLLPTAASGVGVQILALVSLGLLAGLLAALVVARLLDASRFPPRVSKAISGVQQALSDLSERPRATIQALLGALAIQAFFVMQNVLIAEAIGIEAPVAAWFIAWPLAKLVALTPVSLGGLGVREGALAALLVPFGVDPTLAVAESLVWQTVMIALGVICGTSSWWAGKMVARASDALESASDLQPDRTR